MLQDDLSNHFLNDIFFNHPVFIIFQRFVFLIYLFKNLCFIILPRYLYLFFCLLIDQSTYRSVRILIYLWWKLVTFIKLESLWICQWSLGVSEYSGFRINLPIYICVDKLYTYICTLMSFNAVAPYMLNKYF